MQFGRWSRFWRARWYRIAACRSICRHGLTVLPLDKDFDLIAQITGQPMGRLNVSPLAVTDNDANQAEA